MSGIDDISGIGVNGFGMAFDLGATYKWNDFDFSLAINDLGWISYSNTAMASTNGTKEFTTDAIPSRSPTATVVARTSSTG